MEKQPLEIAEYVFLAGSALGTVAAVVSKQVVFAATPLTVALALNLANRHRFQQQTEQYSQSVLAETNQVVESLQQQVRVLPAINNQLDALHQKFNTR